MDQDELKRLMGISQSDQTATDGEIFARNIATATFTYYKGLKLSGMTDEEAMRLTENFQPAYLNMLASMTAIQNAMKGKQ